MSRHRCCVVGCNPRLNSRQAAAQHRESTGHRFARWPVRSTEGHRRQRERNRYRWELEREIMGYGPDEHDRDPEAEAESFNNT